MTKGKMRILFIYKEYKDRRKLYGKMMENLGHHVTYLFVPHKTNSNQISINDIKKSKPDLIWLLNPFYIAYKGISNDTMGYIKSKNIPIAMYGTFNVRTPYMDWVDSVWKKIDFLFAHSSQMVDDLKSVGINSYYMPLGFYPSQYSKKISSKTIDVSFMGNAMGCVPVEEDKRVIYLNSLKYHNIKVYGKSLRKRLEGICVEDYKGHKKQREIYAKTKINLDFPFVNSVDPFYSDRYHVKNRLFEVPATCNFLLTVRNQEFLDMFGDDTIGYYDDNVESLRSSVDKYLKDKKMRKEMAYRAYKLVHQKYTYQHMFNRMFGIIDS
jgi:spore maturation protein CgeB